MNLGTVKKFSALLIIVCMQAYCMEEGNFHTLEGYRSLTEPQKEALYAEADKKLKTGRVFTREHPIIARCPDMLGGINDFAKEINEKYPTKKIYGLGQTPAYFLEAAKILEQQRGQSTERFGGNIAFSGKWHELVDGEYKPKKPLPWPLSCLVSTCPSDEDHAAYRQYLTSIELSPTQILARQQNKGQKTVIVEHTQSGAGLASFTETVKKWTDDLGIKTSQMNSAMEFFILHMAYHRGASPTKACSPFVKNAIGFEYDDYEGELIGHLANADGFDDRLVMYYPFTKWRTHNPHDFQLSRNAQLCLFRIIDYVSLDGHRRKPSFMDTSS